MSEQALEFDATPLTNEERVRFRQLQIVVERGLSQFLAMGLAKSLTTISRTSFAVGIRSFTPEPLDPRLFGALRQLLLYVKQLSFHSEPKLL